MRGYVTKTDQYGQVLYYAGIKRVNGKPSMAFARQKFCAKLVSEAQLKQIIALKKETVTIIGE